MENTFKNNDEFYDFIDKLRLDLIAGNFLEANKELNFILHETAYTTSSEVLGDIKLSLLKLKSHQNEKLPQQLITKINLILNTIENAFYIANGKV